MGRPAPHPEFWDVLFQFAVSWKISRKLVREIAGMIFQSTFFTKCHLIFLCYAQAYVLFSPTVKTAPFRFRVFLYSLYVLSMQRYNRLSALLTSSTASGHWQILPFFSRSTSAADHRASYAPALRR